MYMHELCVRIAALEAKLAKAKDALREITEDPDTATLLAEHALEGLADE